MGYGDRRIIVQGASDNRQWMWMVGVPGAKPEGIATVCGRGRALTRWGAFRKARRHLRYMDRQRRHTERVDVIDVSAPHRTKG